MQRQRRATLPVLESWMTDTTSRRVGEEQQRGCVRVRLAPRTLTMVAKLSSASTMSEAPLATAVPDPMATPMSASLSAGASFTPSPVMATT